MPACTCDNRGELELKLELALACVCSQSPKEEFDRDRRFPLGCGVCVNTAVAQIDRF